MQIIISIKFLNDVRKGLNSAVLSDDVRKGLNSAVLSDDVRKGLNSAVLSGRHGRSRTADPYHVKVDKSMV